MTDPRFTRLANVLIDHSTRLKAGEHLLVEAFDIRVGDPDPEHRLQSFLQLEVLERIHAQAAQAGVDGELLARLLHQPRHEASNLLGQLLHRHRIGCSTAGFQPRRWSIPVNVHQRPREARRGQVLRAGGVATGSGSRA